MVSFAEIQDFSRRIAEAFHPDRIILFGSHAYGHPHEDSDVDLRVVMPDDGNPLRAAAEIRRRIDNTFPVDVIVRDPQTLRWRIENEDSFLREIVEKGRVLHEAAHG